MQKTFSLFLGVLFALTLSAEQMPQGYYDALNGKKDADLKTAIHKIIGGGQRYDYGSQGEGAHTKDKVDDCTGDTLHKAGDYRYGTWSAYPFTDLESDGTIWDMYSNIKRYLPINGGSAASMDIEHSLPKSWWGGEKGCLSAYSDLYLLNPADHQTNMLKSNFPPGVLTDSSKVNNGVFFMGQDKTWGGYAFDVIDEYKGDFARAYFYTATAYEHVNWVTDYKKYINNDSYLGFTDHLVEVLLAWHRVDPVSEKEVDRQDAVSSIQHNRNAFIDYPDLVEYIWGNKKGQEVDLSKLTCTTDGTYEFPVSPTNPLAHEATQIMKDSFMAHWSNTGADEYELNVFTRAESGKNDTLFAIYGMNGAALQAHMDTMTLHKANGDKITSSSGITNGSYAILLGTKSEVRYFLIQNIDFAEPAELVIKCGISKDEKESQQMVVSADDKEIKTITLTANDSFPRFDIPAGAKVIKIASVKGHRLSVHQLFVLRGDYKLPETSVDGFPVKVDGLSYMVKTPFAKGDKLYYRVTPKGLRATNTIEVIGNGEEPQAIENVSESVPFEVQKLLIDGQVIIIRNGVKYTVLGERL